MNSEILKGKWTEVKGKVRAQWGKLTDDDLEQVQGRKDQLAGALQKRYGYKKDEANKKIDEFMGRLH